MTTPETSPIRNAEKPEFSGRVALVTGGSRGIGRAIALELAQLGASVAICARSHSQLEAMQAELTQLGVPHLAESCDVSDESAVSNLVSHIANELGPIDILVNNAGIYRTESVQEQSLQNWEQTLKINLTGSMLFARAALAGMIDKSWGRIINISSISGRTGEIWGSAYSASKFGMIGLTQSLALEVARHNITCNAVCPGWVATEMATAQLTDPEYCEKTGTSPEDSISNACFAIPQNRMIEPEEVAKLVAFLASDSARGITGQSINICGGMSLH
jgi:3-oxoacyl-[acyl-carrier protein] reductase